MTVRLLATLIALVMLLSGCHKAGNPTPPSPTPVATVTEVVPVPVPVQSPSPSPSGKGIATKPDPALCGADKLMPYLNLLPTSTAKGEIARTAGHNRIRYVAAGARTPDEFRPDRLTVELGVDGRIKQFRCG
jgi:hypothetical protein